MLTTRDLRIVTKLTSLARENTVNLRCSHAAALYHKNRIISVGFNQTKTDPWFYKFSKSQNKRYQHAEHNCLKNLHGDFRRSTLYVLRIDRNNEYNQSKPCEICCKIIKSKNIHRVVHSIENGIVEWTM